VDVPELWHGQGGGFMTVCKWCGKKIIKLWVHEESDVYICDIPQFKRAEPKKAKVKK
jgi:hypothetical protein